MTTEEVTRTSYENLRPAVKSLSCLTKPKLILGGSVCLGQTKDKVASGNNEYHLIKNLPADETVNLFIWTSLASTLTMEQANTQTNKHYVKNHFVKHTWKNLNFELKKTKQNE